MTALLERAAPLAGLAALLADARRGEGRIALVSGEAGIGKTSLLREFARQHATPPLRLFWGGCDALLTPRPLAPLQDVAWEHGGALAAHLRAGTPRDEIFRVFLDELRPPHPPALVVFEDVHWADDATLDLLTFLGRRVARTCALIVISWRDPEALAGDRVRSVLGELPHDASARFALAPLSAAAVATLSAASGRAAVGLHAATGGNPFFVTEVLASDAGAVPATIRDAVLARAERLTAAARELLAIAAVAPTRIEVPLLTALAGPAAAALDELLAAALLLLDGDTVAFRHELARRAIEDAIAPLRARALHRAVLAWLRARPEDPAELARLVHHAERAGDGAAVLALASRAAERADRLGAHREAAAFLAAALANAPAHEPRPRATLLSGYAGQCFLIDRMQEGFDAATEALALWTSLDDRRGQSEALRRLARIRWYQLGSDEARGYAARASEVLDGTPPGRALAMAWSTRSQLLVNGSAAAEGLRWGEQALALARQVDAPEVVAHALNNVGCARVQLGDPRGWADLEASLDLALTHGLIDDALRAYGNLGTLAVEERRYAEAARWLERGIAYAGDHDVGVIRRCSVLWRAQLQAVTSQWDTLAAPVAQPFRLKISRHVALTALGLMHTRRGDPEAWPALDEALAIARENNEAERLVPVAAARAELAWLEGDLARTRAEVEDVLALAIRTGRAWYIGELAMWAVRGGAPAPVGVPVARPYALHLAGDWAGASAEFTRLGAAYDAALALYESDDHEALKAAVATLDRLDARPGAARLRRRLAELGARGIPRGPRPARRAHPFGLTAREQDVLGALALGLSNAEIGKRLFVSAKTVDHHVSAILAKLEVATRGDAVAAARRHGLLDPQGDK